MRLGAFAVSIALHAAVVGAGVVLAVDASTHAPLDVRWRPSEPSTVARFEPEPPPSPAAATPPPVPAVHTEVAAAAVDAGEPIAECAPAPALSSAAADAADAADAAAPGGAPRRSPSAAAWRTSLRAPAPVPAPPPPPSEPEAPTTAAHAPAAAAVASAAAAFVDAAPDESRNVPPEYPPESRQRSEAGVVVLELQVDATGAVSDARVLVSSGHRRLDRAALQALRRWTFHPARRDGAAVPARVERSVVFELRGSSD